MSTLKKSEEKAVSCGMKRWGEMLYSQGGEALEQAGLAKSAPAYGRGIAAG